MCVSQVVRIRWGRSLDNTSCSFLSLPHPCSLLPFLLHLPGLFSSTFLFSFQSSSFPLPCSLHCPTWVGDGQADTGWEYLSSYSHFHFWDLLPWPRIQAWRPWVLAPAGSTRGPQGHKGAVRTGKKSFVCISLKWIQTHILKSHSELGTDLTLAQEVSSNGHCLINALGSLRNLYFGPLTTTTITEGKMGR